MLEGSFKNILYEMFPHFCPPGKYPSEICPRKCERVVLSEDRIALGD
jgi:hypothetical protein